jgi:hypothetical protein
MIYIASVSWAGAARERRQGGPLRRNGPRVRAGSEAGAAVGVEHKAVFMGVAGGVEHEAASMGELQARSMKWSEARSYIHG